LVGIDKMSLCTAFEGVNSSLPLVTSSPLERLSPPRRGCAIWLDQLLGEQFGLQTKPSVEADGLPENQGKKGGALIFSPASRLPSPPSRWARGNFAGFDVALARQLSAK